MVLLTAASLIAPAILAYQVWHHQVTDGIAIVVGSVALFLLVVTRMAQLLRQIERQSRQLSELTRVDELTGLPNRRAWSTELPAAIERARRDRVELSIAMLDLDHFKRFNDEYGHQAGDRLLKGATAAWSAQLRAVDQLARYGGEEFIVLLPGPPPNWQPGCSSACARAPLLARPSRPAWPPGTGAKPPRTSSPAPTRPSTRPKQPAATASSSPAWLHGPRRSSAGHTGRLKRRPDAVLQVKAACHPVRSDAR